MVWLNKRYYSEQGLDILDASIIADICDQLLRTYGVSSLKGLTDDEADSVKLGADRYGGSDGTEQGGSGRCGSRGMLNAKGIGPTPLVSKNAAWGYSHGCLYLYDALKEAIASEICGAELDNGSIPIIAIIDAGFSISESQENSPHRCAIYVRPNFIRASHLERSIFFGTSGYHGSDQAEDAKRTRDYNVRLHNGQINGVSGFSLFSYSHDLASQIASARAHRIWNGRPVTGNLTINAQYFDYGAFRSLPHWGKADDGHGQVFGDEGIDIERSISSLSFFYNKYCSGSFGIEKQKVLFLDTLNKIDSNFSSCCINAWFGANSTVSDSETNELRSEIVSFYKSQQRQTYILDNQPTSDNTDWISARLNNILIGKNNSDSTCRLSFLISDIEHSRNFYLSSREFPTLRCLQWAEPRPDLQYTIATTKARSAVASFIRGETAISEYIRNTISSSRRVWSYIPSYYIIIGYSYEDYFESVFVYSERGGYDILYRLHTSLSGAALHRTRIDRHIIYKCAVSNEVAARITILSKKKLVEYTDTSNFPIIETPRFSFNSAVRMAEFLGGKAPWKL
ncbi:hypothetical protein N4G62_07925 [Sphingomonas sanguinis]|uniref:Uncharacterized protein n=1 Tax=Sphingomonas sanguinis TaxID=33051 RepID=A0ABU5LPV1_9SPHN|nr:hypothetical protein [Sphingomonas sanguinis]MDZ7281952.1 hypothetical protein [Sphingomonas sanguinis]